MRLTFAGIPKGEKFLIVMDMIISKTEENIKMFYHGYLNLRLTSTFVSRFAVEEINLNEKVN